MKKTYIYVAVIVLLIISATTLFYIFTKSKTEKIEKNIKKVETFGVGGSSQDGFFGVNLFGGAKDELGGNVDLNFDDSSLNGAKKQDNTIELLYDLPTCAADFHENSTVIFTDKINGYSFLRKVSETKNTELKQNALHESINASYSKSYILREKLNDDFEAEFNLEKINDNKSEFELSKQIVSCQLTKDDKLLCLERLSGSYAFRLLDLSDDTDKGKILYKSAFKHWIYKLQNDSLYLLQKPSAKKESAFLKVDSNGNVDVLDYGVGLESIISDDGKTILSSAFVNGKPVLYIKKLDSHEKFDLPIQTLASKCVFLKEKLLCAVPKKFPENIALPDTWLKGKYHFDDEFYTIDTSTAFAEKLKVKSMPTESIDVYKIKVNQDKNKVLFINKNNLKLWLIELAADKNDIIESDFDSETEATSSSSTASTTEEEIEIELKRNEI